MEEKQQEKKTSMSEVLFGLGGDDEKDTSTSHKQEARDTQLQAIHKTQDNIAENAKYSEDLMRKAQRSLSISSKTKTKVKEQRNGRER
jgi:hypothetical protein